MTQMITTLNSPHPAAPLASLRSVSIQYGALSVLQDVTLDLHAGEFVSVTGPSGSGKSTLLSLLGLLERPSRGQVFLHGQDAWTLSDRAQSRLRGETLGFVFQGFHLLPELSALDNVARPLRWAGGSRATARERAQQALESVGLGARAGHRPAQLSGGEQQRVAIARAIVREPALLLADEPTGNLPQRLWEEILDLFAGLHARGHTVVVVTHDPLVAARARRHIVLQDGRVVEDGGS